LKSKTLSAVLYFGFRGSASCLDWTTNFDARPTASQCDSIKVHSGFFSVYNNVKDKMDSMIMEVANKDCEGLSVQLEKVVFTGHSLGGGIAQLCNLQAWAASADSHWPTDPDFRPSSESSDVDFFALTFAAPPSCFIDEEDEEDAVGEAVRRHSCNYIMEYDVVPRLANAKFVEDALASEAQYAMGGARRLAIPLMAAALSPQPQILRDVHSVASRLRHCSSLGVISAMEHPQKSWRILLLQNPDDIQRFLLTPWPFEGKSSELAITDHKMLPSRLVKEWRRDSCMNSMMDMNCQALHADTFELDKFDLVDCRLCSMTFCKGCHKKLHTRCSWHPKSDRRSDACGVVMKKVRPQNLFDTVVTRTTTSRRHCVKVMFPLTTLRVSKAL